MSEQVNYVKTNMPQHQLLSTVTNPISGGILFFLRLLILHLSVFFEDPPAEKLACLFAVFFK